jgi:hypothetical protein
VSGHGGVASLRSERDAETDVESAVEGEERRRVVGGRKKKKKMEDKIKKLLVKYK